MNRPFSQACENNKNYILEKLATIVQSGDNVLEIGSGTAQHARYFAEHLGWITWHPAEIREHMRTLEAGLQSHGLSNLRSPVTVDVSNTWPVSTYEGIFSANCLHIMSADCVELFFQGVAERVKPEGFLCMYGPFKYGGEFTTPSNARFDDWLKDRNPLSGVRDFEWVNGLAAKAGFSLVADYSMPANNQFIHWQKAV